MVKLCYENPALTNKKNGNGWPNIKDIAENCWNKRNLDIANKNFAVAQDTNFPNKLCVLWVFCTFNKTG